MMHVDQYMKYMGFYDAALDLLIPLTGSWESAPGNDPDNTKRSSN